MSTRPRSSRTLTSTPVNGSVPAPLVVWVGAALLGAEDVSGLLGVTVSAITPPDGLCDRLCALAGDVPDGCDCEATWCGAELLGAEVVVGVDGAVDGGEGRLELLGADVTVVAAGCGVGG